MAGGIVDYPELEFVKLALNIAVKVGEKAYVEGRFLQVQSYSGPTQAVVVNDVGQEFEITDSRAVEVYPKVMVSIGLKSVPGRLSLTFIAPRDIKIWREGHAPADWTPKD